MVTDGLRLKDNDTEKELEGDSEKEPLTDAEAESKLFVVAEATFEGDVPCEADNDIDGELLVDAEAV